MIRVNCSLNIMRSRSRKTDECDIVKHDCLKVVKNQVANKGIIIRNANITGKDVVTLNYHYITCVKHSKWPSPNNIKHYAKSVKKY